MLKQYHCILSTCSAVHSATNVRNVNLTRRRHALGVIKEGSVRHSIPGEDAPSNESFLERPHHRLNRGHAKSR